MKHLLITCALLTGCAELENQNTENGPADSFEDDALAEITFATESVSAGSALPAPIDLGNIFVAGDSEGRHDTSFYPENPGATVSYTFSTPRARPVSVSVAYATAAEIQPTRGTVIRLTRDEEGILRYEGPLDGTYRLVIGPQAAPMGSFDTDFRRTVTLDASYAAPETARYCVFGSQIAGSEIRSTVRYPFSGSRNSLYRYIGNGRLSRTNAFVRVSQTLVYSDIADENSSFDNLRFLPSLTANYNPYPTIQERDYLNYQRITARGDDGQTYELHAFGGFNPRAFGLIYRSGSNTPVFAMKDGEIVGCTGYVD